MEHKPKYVIITPVRDEEAYLEKTIGSVLSQTVLPQEWIIVNDGSKDRTGEIIERYARKHPWIHPVHRENRGFRSAGGGVIEAFYAGYSRLRADWDYIVKLDADLSFEHNFFEKCFDYFRKEPETGICGGSIYNLVREVWTQEVSPLFHVRGATKIYKKACWEAIGGLPKVPGWDTVDEVKANMLGWKTRTLLDLKVMHYRSTGAADGNLKTFIKYGRANYFTGYHPLFLLAKCAKRVFEKPYLVGSLALLYGYITGYLKSMPRVEDKALIAYVRKQQLNKLLSRDTIWK